MKDLQESVQRAYSIKPSEWPKITYKNGTVINPTVLALLLDYKQKTYADFDPMEEFTPE